MPRVVLRVDSNFDEQAARAAAREAERYWTRQSEQLKVSSRSYRMSENVAVWTTQSHPIRSVGRWGPLGLPVAGCCHSVKLLPPKRRCARLRCCGPSPERYHEAEQRKRNTLR